MSDATRPPEASGPGSFRIRLASLLADFEERLVVCVLALAQEHGYTRHTTTRYIDWRDSVRDLSAALTAALRSDMSLELNSEADFGEDALTGYGIREARLHRSRGVDMSLFLGLFKQSRRAYHTVVWETAAQDDRLVFRTLLNRLFDRIEIALAADWAGEGKKSRIDRLNQANRALALDKNRYLSIFESALTPIMIFDDHLTLANCNLAAATLLHSPRVDEPAWRRTRPEELLAPWQGRAVAVVAPWLAEELGEFFFTASAQSRIEITRVLQGAVRIFQVSFSRLHGVLLGRDAVVAEIQDITLLRNQEQEVREGRTLLQRVLDGVGAGILVIDPTDLSILYCNEQAADITGRDKARLLGGRLPDIEFLDRNNRPLHGLPLLDAGAAHEELRLRRPDGTIVPVAKTVVTAPLHGSLKIVQVLFDISRQKEMERRLMQSQKLESIGQLAAGIAHEINTPIQYVGGNVDFLEGAFAAYEKILAELGGFIGSCGGECQALAPLARTDKDLAMYRAEVPLAIAQTKEGVARVTSIVQGIRRFSHPGGETRKPADLNKALLATLEVARYEWKQVAETELRLDPDLPPVWCSLGEINQVFLNIVLNAGQAIAERVGKEGGKGRITVTTSHAPDKVTIFICDTGAGIRPEHQGQVFNPFFTTKPPGKGTGQGLAIAHAIIERHKGSLDFSSTLGQGTCFRIQLPSGGPPGPEAA